MSTATASRQATRRPQVRQTTCFIGGEWVPAVSGKSFATIDPATEEPICEIAEGDAEDVDLAVRAARKAFEQGEWSRMDASERGRLIYRLADLMEAEAGELAALETLDNGKPIRDSRAADVPLAIDCLRYYAGLADKIQGDTIPIKGDYFCYTRREPVGVVGQIIPWNFPMLMVAWKWGPALAAGCTIVMKPAEQTPLTCLRMARLAQKAGIPDGVINVVPGYGPDSRRGTREASGRRQNRVYRRTRHGADHHERSRPDAEAPDVRAGWQESQHRIRRLRPHGRRRGCSLGPVLQSRTMLLRRQPRVCAGVDP